MRMITIKLMRIPVNSTGRLFSNARVNAISHVGTQWMRKIRTRSPRLVRSIKGIRGSKASSRNKVPLLDDEQIKRERACERRSRLDGKGLSAPMNLVRGVHKSTTK